MEVSKVSPWIKTRSDETIVLEFQSILYRD